MSDVVKEEPFAALALLAVCGTVAAVAVHHGLGMWQTAGWVGLAAGATLFFELYRHVAKRVLPQADPITQLNFALCLDVGMATSAVALIGAVTHDVTAVGVGLAVAILNGTLGYSMLRRYRD